MKRILKLILPMTGKAGLLKYIGLGILSGLCSFLFINTVTSVLGQIIAGNFTNTHEYLLIFVAIILLFIWIRRVLSVAIIRLSQTLFWDLRKQIVSLVLRSGYQQLSARKTEVHSAIVSDVNMLTQASQSIIDFFTATVLMVVCFAYLATLSLLLFGITLVVALTGIGIYRLRASMNVKNFQRSRALETSFQSSFNAILDGFKELFMDPRKGKDIFDHQVRPVSTQAFDNNTKAYIGFLNNQITGYTLFYTLIAAILIYLNTALKIEVKYTVTFVFTLLYLLGAINTIMVLLPVLVRARVSAGRLLELKDKLEREDSPVGAIIPGPPVIFKNALEQITISQLVYEYGATSQAFGIGPIDLEIRKGDVIFIYGGNGSGKTTFIHTLLGLRIPTGGEIRVNDIPVSQDLYPQYKAFYAVVFSDFYLFSELLGIDKPDLEKWRYYLQLFELEDKVSIDDKGVFSTTALSTGQRKRLALIAALLEEKPLLVIDEWAADQDPHFRKKFYTEIIPLIRQTGITIIAITHDDRYYHCADKLFRMEYGKLIPERVQVFQ
ncbi:cyclic peptide export ABC transporter [uncultured Chitinophaga sp.]|jgi:cyclic peptide transporter|uniref:cyclic peptide export ABC transporter n=1 Tax=uncultured Chitinophaga sp. TaxID=339340 RepID=UPI00260A98DF|nr:cyclic peptide export ABC transporter [uncultured Chitinophaga sp.]